MKHWMLHLLIQLDAGTKVDKTNIVPPAFREYATKWGVLRSTQTVTDNESIHAVKEQRWKSKIQVFLSHLSTEYGDSAPGSDVGSRLFSCHFTIHVVQNGGPQDPIPARGKGKGKGRDMLLTRVDVTCSCTYHLAHILLARNLVTWKGT